VDVAEKHTLRRYLPLVVLDDAVGHRHGTLLLFQPNGATNLGISTVSGLDECLRRQAAP
jgi:hypothetical protein